SPSKFALARCLPDGSLDSDFNGDGNGDGMVTTVFGGDGDVAFGVALQADGKIVVAGNAQHFDVVNTSAFALARYNTDGSLDSDFDADGKVTTNFGASFAIA